MSKGTPVRTVRVPDDLWTAVRDRATAEGTTASAVVLERLREYAAPPTR